jgi:hypothetical protein
VLAPKHPAYGCNKLEALLMAEGKRPSSVTIRKIRQNRQMGSRYERLHSIGFQRPGYTVK